MGTLWSIILLTFWRCERQLNAVCVSHFFRLSSTPRRACRLKLGELFGKTSVRRNFRRQKLRSAKFPFGEIYVRRKFRSAKIPSAKITSAKIPSASYIKHRHTVWVPLASENGVCRLSVGTNSSGGPKFDFPLRTPNIFESFFPQFPEARISDFVFFNWRCS